MKNLRRILLAVGLGLAANLLLLLVSGLLQGERAVSVPPPMSAPVGLVNLRQEAVREEERAPDPEPPEPRPEPEFTPDIMRPSLSAPGLDLGLAIPDLSIPQPRFDAEGLVFEAGDLDTPPRIVTRLAPAYPYRARQRNQSGDVRVRFLVNPDGAITDVTILESTNPGWFEDAVMRTVPSWRVEPGVIDGEPVAAWMVTTVVFQLGQ